MQASWGECGQFVAQRRGKEQTKWRENTSAWRPPVKGTELLTAKLWISKSSGGNRTLRRDSWISKEPCVRQPRGGGGNKVPKTH